MRVLVRSFERGVFTFANVEPFEIIPAGSNAAVGGNVSLHSLEGGARDELSDNEAVRGRQSAVVICRNMNVIINGEERSFPEFGSDTKLAELIAVLGLKGDRIAVEHNGEIAVRSGWDAVVLNPGDKLEIVHFVGGGLA